LVFVLSLPFWAAGAATARQLMPRLPVSALMTVCPLVAALLLCYRERGARGVLDVLRRAADLGRITNRAWYAPDPLQARWGALGAGLLLGLVCATWHVVPLVQARRAPVWIAWWALGTLALRVLTEWHYNNTGRSVAAAALFHATQNLAWQLFPDRGSHYDPRVTGLVLTGVAVAVVAVSRPGTLMRAPRPRRPRARGLVRP
jgi:hypothetical protein